MTSMMTNRKNFHQRALLRRGLNTMAMLMAGFVLCSCNAHTGGRTVIDGDIVIYDPLEENNRRILAFNQKVDHVLINPIVKGYRTVAPKPVRKGVRNFLRNLRSPVTFANQVLQGDLKGAGDALVRAVVNTTLGVGGLFDLAGHEGIEYEPEDFGQTLAVWGVDHGPYLVVPVLGPSSLRDYTGYFADGFMDPLRWYLFNIDEEELYFAKVGVDYLDLRESLMDVLEDLEASSIDYYASVRSTYYQRREAMVKDLDASAVVAAPEIPDYDETGYE